MIRHLTLVSFVGAAAAAGLLFVTAHRAQQRERDLDGISKAIHDQREAIVVLEAEWAYLNRLERLQQLSTRYLDLAPMTPERMVRLEDIPIRAPAPTVTNDASRLVPQGRTAGERRR